MSLVIVTSHWKEDLSWLKKSRFPVVLIDKEGADPTCFEAQHIIPNKGLDAAAYFTYIIENYDNLPDHVAFIHGHETSWHHRHDRPLLEVIESANIQKYEYIPLNNFIRIYGFCDEPKNVDSSPGMKLKSFWNFLNLPPLPDMTKFVIPICSQFIVSRRRILNIPKELWKELLRIVVTAEGDDAKIWPNFFEFIYHIIFSESIELTTHDDWFSFPYTINYWHLIPECCEPKPISS